MTRETICGSCDGSGMRCCLTGSGYVESVCFDCNGEGSWIAEPAGKAPAREPYVPSPEYLAWCAEVDARKELIALRDADASLGDPLLRKDAA